MELKPSGWGGGGGAGGRGSKEANKGRNEPEGGEEQSSYEDQYGLLLTRTTYERRYFDTKGTYSDCVADPYPGSGAFLTPGSGIRDGKKSRARIRDEHPGSYF